MENIVDNIIKEIDNNQSGKIDFTGNLFSNYYINIYFKIEFIVAATKKEKMLSKIKIDHAFKLFDEDNSGFIE